MKAGSDKKPAFFMKTPHPKGYEVPLGYFSIRHPVRRLTDQGLKFNRLRF